MIRRLVFFAIQRKKRPNRIITYIEQQQNDRSVAQKGGNLFTFLTVDLSIISSNCCYCLMFNLFIENMRVRGRHLQFNFPSFFFCISVGAFFFFFWNIRSVPKRNAYHALRLVKRWASEDFSQVCTTVARYWWEKEENSSSSSDSIFGGTWPTIP